VRRIEAGWPANCGTPLKFDLLDKIESLSPVRIVAWKQVSLAEEYLADHFPSFPVLPGVLMLEALTQAAAWLMHVRNGFSRSLAVLREARGVKYGRFVAPGQRLRIEVELVRGDDRSGLFRGTGTVDAVQAVSARLEMAYFNLAEVRPDLAAVDERLRKHNQRRWALLEPRENESSAGAVARFPAASTPDTAC